MHSVEKCICLKNRNQTNGSYSRNSRKTIFKCVICVDTLLPFLSDSLADRCSLTDNHPGLIAGDKKTKRSSDDGRDLLLCPVTNQWVNERNLRQWTGWVGGQSGGEVTKVPIDENKIRRGGMERWGEGVTGNLGYLS